MACGAEPRARRRHLALQKGGAQWRGVVEAPGGTTQTAASEEEFDD